MDEDELRRLAAEARGRLAELIPDEQARREADVDLEHALAQPPGSAKPALMAALRAHEGVRRWVATDTDRLVGQLGDVTSPLGVLYVCSRKDYAVVRESPTGDDLVCPNDGSPLERYTG
jgi:hypothetical protein